MIGEWQRIEAQPVCDPLGLPMNNPEREKAACYYARYLAARDGVELGQLNLWRAVWHREHVGEGRKHYRDGVLRYQSPPPYKALYIEAIEFARGVDRNRWGYGGTQWEIDDETRVVVPIPNPDKRTAHQLWQVAA